jgi:CRISPR/Cas system-associated exonuclease Cas4 (RecB family)
MTLAPDFHFSQGNLQDYVDCPRRFQLRYMLCLPWPAVEAEPALENERYLQQGAAYHHLVHQYLVGVPPEQLTRSVTDQDLSRWWKNYLQAAPVDSFKSRYPEIVLSAPLNEDRLIAKYDVIAVDPGKRAAIVDWKTSRRRPSRDWLAKRIQTRVYPYLVVRAGSFLNDGKPFEPEQVNMIYWFPNFPEQSEEFLYNRAQYEADGDYLISLIEEIKGLADQDFPLTAQERRCRYCLYRSLCRQGDKAGLLDEAEEEPELLGDFEFALDFEQIAEIEY